jgi:hypothetical protein
VTDRRLAPGRRVAAAQLGVRRQPLGNIQDSAGLERVAAIGMGVMMVRAEVFQTMPQPWFHIHFSPDSAVYTGEDIWFCRGSREAGFEVWLDHDLSQHVRHIGNFEFSNSHAAAARGD